MKVEDEGVKELLEIHDDELTTDELKECCHQQCEEKEMKILSKDKGGEKKKLLLLTSKRALIKLEQVRNIANKWNQNKSTVITTANLFNESFIQFFRNIFLKSRKKQL